MTLLTRYHIYSCAEWGARDPGQTFPSTRAEDSIVHHMDWPNRPLIEDSGEAVQRAFEVARSCQADHMDNNGWADTGQDFTVTRDGIILEGRHGALDALMAGHCERGAHCADPDVGVYDNNSWGVEHEGNYTSEQMPIQQEQAAIWLQALICLKTRLDTSTIKGHKDTGCETACPGDWLHAQLPRWREQTHTLKLQMMAEG